MVVCSEMLVMPDEVELSQVDEMDTASGMSGSGMDWDGDSHRVQPGVSA